MTARPDRQRRALRRGRQAAPATAIAVAVLVGLLLPVYWVGATSVRDRMDVIVDPLGAPTNPTLDNFVRAWIDGNFSTYFVNSVIVAVPTVAAVVVLSLLAGFALAVYRFPGRNLIFGLFIIGLTIPIGVLVIPLFYQMKAMALLDTPMALILPQVALGLPLGILLMRGYIQELPRELLDAARVDGCTDWQLLVRIVAPLSRPVTLSLIVLTFMWTWNQFILAVVLTQTEESRTLPIGLSLFRGRFGVDLPVLMAGACITFLPILLVYLVFQRHFIRGISAGAFK